MIWDAGTFATIKDVASAGAIIAFQVYNVWRQQHTAAKVRAVDSKIDVDYNDLRTDLNAARESLEKLAVKLNGSDRRRTTIASVSNADAKFGKARWTDETKPWTDPTAQPIASPGPPGA